MDVKPVLFVIGLLLSILAISMTVPMLIDLHNNNPDWKVFFFCIMITAFFGGSLTISTNSNEFNINVREAFLLVFLSWFSIALFGAFPFYLSELEINFTDSFFESMSGITTTGSTVLTGLESTPPGILIWRAILQWLGGIGIILMAMSILPFLKVGGMQIFRAELSEDEKALPRITQLASSIGLIYLILTIICALCYIAVGMTPFNALAHALTTISTGGFSTFDSSFSHYKTAAPEIMAIIFMIMGGLPFVLYIKFTGGNFKAIARDTQTQTFFGFLICSSLLIILHLILTGQMNLVEATYKTIFNVVSIMTGTGYASMDYALWGSFAVSIFFFLSVVGGCAGSTSCGIKIFRFQVLYAIITTQFKRLLYPHGVFIPYYNGRPIPEDVPLSVMSFFFLYAVCFVFLSLALAFVGLDFVTATSGAITSISNVGPGLGPIIGPAGTFKALPDSAKWILCFGMFLGRLEVFTVLVFLSPHFWSR